MDIASESAFLGPLVNSTFLPMLLLSLAGQKHTPRTAKTIYREYDYVIVGGGSAGSVLASRLSEIPCVKILLLEAGGPPPLVSEIPAIERLLWHTRIDWDFRTAPQRYTGEALKDRQIVWPSGKTLGGSSVLNAMLTVRGNRQNYDDWAALGATGWSYKDVLPYFIKMEDNRDPEYVANGYHGVGGPQTIHRPRYQPEIKDPIFEASRLMGDKIVDINGRTQIGIYDIQATLRSGQRCSTAKAYLVPAENRTNLDILPNALVRKVIIENRRAIGVRFDFQGDTFEVKAKREVIMSAGTTNSAQLLMLSGIGPRKELERFKIPVIADLPVGKNMQDHCGVPLLFLLSPSIPSALFKVFSPPNILQYITTRTGPLTSASLIPAMSFLNGNHSHTKHSIPDYELYFAELPVEIAETTFGLREEIFEQYYGPYRGRGTYSCISQILHPRSRGTVTLQSTNPSDPPLIDPNYFEDPKDIQDIVEGMKKCMRIGTSGPLQKVGSTPLPNIFPGCEDSATDEDSYYWCMARQFVVTFNHQVGTAKMGDPRDPTTVVDPQLRVKHIKGLRVVDASIMPLVPSGNTNLPTIMVAEKASDIIKSTIKCGGEDVHDEWSHEYPSSSPIHSEDLDHGDQSDFFPGNGNPGLTQIADKWKDAFNPGHKHPVTDHTKVVTPWNNELLTSTNANGLQQLTAIVNILSQLSANGQSPNSSLNQDLASILQQTLPSLSVNSNGNPMSNGTTNSIQDILQSIRNEDNQSRFANLKSAKGAGKSGIKELLSSKLSSLKGKQNGDQNNNENEGNMLSNKLAAILQKKNLKAIKNKFSSNQDNSTLQNNQGGNLFANKLSKLLGQQNENQDGNDNQSNRPNFLQNKLNKMSQKKNNLFNAVSANYNDPSGIIDNGRGKMNFMISKLAQLLGKKNKGVVSNSQNTDSGLNNEQNSNTNFNSMLTELLQTQNNDFSSVFTSGQLVQAPDSNDDEMRSLLQRLSELLQAQSNGSFNNDDSVSQSNTESTNPGRKKNNKLNFLNNKFAQLMQKKNKFGVQASGNDDSQSNENSQNIKQNKYRMLISKLTNMLSKKNNGFLSGRYPDNEDVSFQGYDGDSEAEDTCHSLMNIMRCQINGHCDGDREVPIIMFLHLCNDSV